MIMTYIAWVIMFASWCVAYKTINRLKKELNRFKYNESHYKEVLKRVEGFFRTIDSCRGYPPNTDIGRIANVAFLCKSRTPADPQYVDEWFRFKKMF